MWTRGYVQVWDIRNAHLEQVQPCSEEQVAELDGLLLQLGRLSLDDGDGHAFGSVEFKGS